MFSIDQLIAHLVGDYILQSHWMALEKRRSTPAAFVHALTYTIPFLFITHDVVALAIIAITHFGIDRYGLARYLVWLKNQIGPRAHRAPWNRCKATGYPDDTPPWLATWLMIITDNTLHLICNGLAIAYA